MKEMVRNELPSKLVMSVGEAIIYSLVNGVFWLAFLKIS